MHGNAVIGGFPVLGDYRVTLPDVERQHLQLIVSAPIDGPFGRTFTFADPDGYQVTLHDRA
jgi:predicted enzyme related to lactoylglutathione lyase